mgnify:CR=1
MDEPAFILVLSKAGLAHQGSQAADEHRDDESAPPHPPPLKWP